MTDESDRSDVYVRLTHETVAKTREFFDGILVDLDELNRVVGVEILAPREVTVDGRLVAAPPADRTAERDAVRDRIAHAMCETTGHFGDVLDGVMAVVDPVVLERDLARRARDERLDLALWLHAEAVWRLTESEESRFRGAEEAAECERRVERERFCAGMLRDAVVRELHVLADRDELSTHDIHTLADHIEAGDWLEGDPGPIAAPTDREALGRLVRKVWIGWASEQPNPKPSWLVSWEDLSEPDREVDRRIGETLARAGVSAGVVAQSPAELIAAELERIANTPAEQGPWWQLKTSLLMHAAELRARDSSREAGQP